MNSFQFGMFFVSEKNVFINIIVTNAKLNNYTFCHVGQKKQEKENFKCSINLSISR